LFTVTHLAEERRQRIKIDLATPSRKSINASCSPCARFIQEIENGVVRRPRLLREHHVAGSWYHDVPRAARLEKSSVAH
jgi:hypothetical protein